MSDTELIGKIRELRELKALIEEAQSEAAEIEDALKAYMGDTTELRAGEYKVTWKNVTSSRLDINALKLAMPDVVKAFTRANTIRRFTVA